MQDLQKSRMPNYSRFFNLTFIVLVVSLFIIVTNGFTRNNFHHVGIRSSSRDFDTTNYYASQDAVDWTTALQVCSAIFGGNASLASIETEEESTWLDGYLATRGIIAGIYWTSGLYSLPSASWVWESNPDADFNDFTAWGPGQPNSINSRQRVVLNFLRNASHWESSDDSVRNRMLCEVPVEEIPPIEGEPSLCWDPNSVIILLDSSTALGLQSYSAAQKFASNLSMAFSHMIGKRFGFMTFSLLPQSVIHLQESLYSDVVSNQILGAGWHNYAKRHTADAMRFGMLQLEHYSEGAPKGIVVITGGSSESPAKTKTVADEANAAGIRTYAIGLDYPNPGNELRNIAGGVEERVWQAEAENLKDLLTVVSEVVCVGTEAKVITPCK